MGLVTLVKNAQPEVVLMLEAVHKDLVYAAHFHTVVVDPHLRIVPILTHQLQSQMANANFKSVNAQTIFVRYAWISKILSFLALQQILHL